MPFPRSLSWAYYGEQGWRYLSQDFSPLPYRWLYVGATFVGAVSQPTAILTFSDLRLFAMALPNLLGCLWLSNPVAAAIQDYWHRLTQGTMLPTGKSPVPVEVSNSSTERPS